MSSKVVKKPGSTKVGSTKVGSTKAEKTKAVILNTAENYFSRLGFAATRLEDIAEDVGMTRAALFYYFKDKQMQFDATIANSFGALTNKLIELIDAEDIAISKKMELAVEAWVDSVISRPNLARLIMRFVADGLDQPTIQIFTGQEQIPERFFQLFREGKQSGELDPLHDDPFHAASAILGNTVFYVAALSALLPNQFEPLDPVQVAVHKSEALHSARRLLGING